jgi:hypothetical protein
MEDLAKLIRERMVRGANRRLHSDFHALADEICRAFGERGKFAMYLGVIKRVGLARARAVWAEVRDSKADDPKKLFMWKCSRKSDRGNGGPTGTGQPN